MTTPSLPALPPAPQRGPLQRLAHWFLHRWTGRIVAVSLVVWVLDTAGVPLPGVLTFPAWLVTIAFCWVAGYRLIKWVLRRWLWRIRTKLMLSYLFIAVVPVVLLVLFFGTAAVLSSGLVASYMVSAEAERKTEELRRMAETTFSGLLATGASNQEAAERVIAPARAAYPALSFVFVRDNRVVASSDGLPDRLPAWLKDDSFAGIVGAGEEPSLRAVATRQGSFLILDVPLDQGMFADLERSAGIRFIGAGGTLRSTGGGVNIEFKDDGKPPSAGPPPSASPPAVRVRRARPVDQTVKGLVWAATPDKTDWATGAKEGVGLAFQYDPRVVWRRLSPGSINVTDWLVAVLAVVGVVFLVMYAVALLMGLLLARSITRSVHALSRGTERLRQGRFDQPIPVRTRDQLGELADSFNLMSRDIQQFMRESAEKERLEEELRIARRIQMSLLPQGTVTVPHVSIAAVCIPATEVGGDYYDLLPLPGDRLAVLVADVSGKGTSAALYMAELKGLMLSLSRVHDSPASVLAEANRILTADMDPRSFITMSYAVLEPRLKRMRYARAGHSPLIQWQASTGTTRLLAPPGLGLGLDGGAQFERVLEEVEVPLGSGDVFLFFTDGISEAMNVRGELFGEERLRAVLQQDGLLTSEALRERVLGEVRRFVGEAPQHDDMTMVVLRIE